MILGTLSKLFDLVPVCPEVEAGLGIPRPPVQLTGDLQNPSMIGRDNPALDVTDLMREYTASKLNQLTNLDGFIFKCRSPSCGLNSTPIYIDGKCRTESARGLFAHEFCRSFPQLPVIEDTSLENAWLCEEFITRVNEHWRHKITY